VVAVGTQVLLVERMPLLVGIRIQRLVPQLLIVVVVVVAQVGMSLLQHKVLLVVLVVLWCVGLRQTQQVALSVSHQQEQQRQEQTVRTLGLLGIPQELWWSHNGTLRKSRKRHRA
jgi:hypothetical protein